MTVYRDPATAADVRAGVAADITAMADRYLAEAEPGEYSGLVHRALRRAAEVASGDLDQAAMTRPCLALMVPPPR